MSSEELNFLSRLPEDVSNLILLKLPVKSLLVCTSVCKTWNSFIKSPAFFSSHLNRAIASSDENDANLCLHQICTLPIKTGRDSFFLRSKDQDFSARDRIHFPYKDKYGFQVLSSCNGLILLMHGRYNFKSCPIRLMLWNPVIRKSMIIYEGYNLMPVEAVGLGVDSKTGDFKALTVIEELGNETTLKVQLYSLKANSWKRLPDVEAKYDDKIGTVYRGVTYLNGALYFVARKTLTKPRLVIWEFDLSEEVFHEIMLPDCMTTNPSRFRLPTSNHFHLLTCGESLAVLWFRETIREIEVWVMKECGVRESWTQLSTIKLECLKGLHITGSVFTHDDHVLLSVGSYSDEAGRIFSHDLKSQEIKDIVNTGKHNCVFLGDYVESLALLDKGNDLSSHFEIVSDDANEDTSGNSSSSNADFLMGPSASSNVTNAWNDMDYWSEIGFLLNPGIAYMEEDSDESVESDSGAGHSSEDSSNEVANSSINHASDESGGNASDTSDGLSRSGV